MVVSFSFGVLNCHMGILPKYRGMDVVEWPFLENDRLNVGITCHLMDKGIDTGDILEIVKVDPKRFTSFIDLREYLSGVIGRQPSFLHGGVPRAKRDSMISSFQDGTDTPILLVSLKAGGTGLNLTAANRVIHFDRWWNPAVEEQALPEQESASDTVAEGNDAPSEEQQPSSQTVTRTKVPLFDSSLLEEVAGPAPFGEAARAERAAECLRAIVADSILFELHEGERRVHAEHFRKDH